MRIKSKFYRFLKEHKCFAQYIREFSNGIKQRERWVKRFESHFTNLDCFENIDNFVESIENKAEIIQFSFAWVNTQKGDKYWNALNTLWRREIDGF